MTEDEMVGWHHFHLNEEIITIFNRAKDHSSVADCGKSLLGRSLVTTIFLIRLN